MYCHSNEFLQLAKNIYTVIVSGHPDPLGILLYHTKWESAEVIFEAELSL